MTLCVPLNERQCRASIKNRRLGDIRHFFTYICRCHEWTIREGTLIHCINAIAYLGFSQFRRSESSFSDDGYAFGHGAPTNTAFIERVLTDLIHPVCHSVILHRRRDGHNRIQFGIVSSVIIQFIRHLCGPVRRVDVVIQIADLGASGKKADGCRESE